MTRASFLCFLVFVLCQITEFSVALKEEAGAHPATEFTKHALVKPRIYHGREKRQISSTREEDGGHTHHITVDYDLDGRKFVLDLRLNRDLIPKGYFQRYQQNGKHVIDKPTDDVDLCHYKGTARGLPGSWAAISTCEDRVRGVVFDGHDMHYIENDDRFEDHLLYKHSDFVGGANKTCGFHGPNDDEHHHAVDNTLFRRKRSSEKLVRGPYNANKQSRYVELVLVVDNREYKELGESMKKVQQHSKDIANIINGLYAPLNIYVALVGLVIWSEFDEIVFSPNGDITLTNFLHYRRAQLIKQHPNDNAQLLTKYTFDNGVVGKALKGPICTYEYSGGVNTDHSPILGLVATTVAHEMGHNFGMEHDTNACSCPEERCIMAPSSSTTPPTHWSSCSLEHLAFAFEHGMDYCLRNKPISLFDSPVCGNGFVEPGEQCDCGLPEHCDNTCCNATTCMLHKNASCATGECCDLQTCKPKNAGTMCRSADYECDLPEYCTGQSEYCPDDIYKMDTELCDGGKAYCYNGFCRTRSDQCKLLWGSTGKSSDDQCYKMNTKGTRHGNCGYNKLNQSFVKCQDENVLCGMLHCKHLNERLEFGMESVAILSHTFINLKGHIIPCRTAIVDLGLNQVDPGLSPDGASCGDGKMCVNQKCMPVASLRTAIGNCPQDCNGNGVCNSLGHCHCHDGFAPPFCDYPGDGGSADSGPASDRSGHKIFVAVMFIIFLGIIPTMAIIALLFYFHKNKIFVFRKKSPLTAKSPQKSRSPPFSPESPKRITEDNHSLLSSDQAHEVGEFFGHFKGFTLTPLKKEEPVRPAPPVPTVKTVSRSNSSALNATAPALPPLNPGSHPRPIISSPTLQNSTCTAKELLSPLRNAPKVPSRHAPEAPNKENKIKDKENKRPVSESIAIEDEKKPAKGLNRITSFLKPHDKKPTVVNTNSLPRKSKKFDKDALRTVEISGPIPQTQIDITITALPVEPPPEHKVTVARAQSMKSPENKPKIQSFGSMRDPTKRPVSIVNAVRPKSPPPPRPQEVEKKSQNQYDDCLNAVPISPVSNDNIYAVIEETPITSPESKPVTSSSTSNESFGLLGEIVSEIQNRNFDSIYSTSSLGRKKKAEQEAAAAAAAAAAADTYENASIYKSPESVYSNMNNGKSSASSTSSGYIHPSAVNVPPPQKKPQESQEKKTESKPNLTTFKAESAKAPAAGKTQPSTKGVQAKVVSRQTTPPNLRSRKPSPTRAAATPKAQLKPMKSNSPDLVTSCSATGKGNNAKGTPDVLNNSVKKIQPKPNLPKTSKVTTPPAKTETAKTIPAVKPPIASKSFKGSELSKPKLGKSNVASLQQKFEKNVKT
ncbi:PREDICTED: disintegrin and metalloproteinase domain-containing protein 9 isoform X2 [Nicrophorus vespilloides]|uniref:Disintegrin and metalloproteinase domain-containing protein 9 isoform X2 n=1 Tax=Nicrophorus vespilloides TaxID=110193 RepID=A0ABM1MZ43_NICVS|nr:PREDICTED: disintegrin and metalloproteinase domain-containing protein 9 isoform X2 [Nicrophorus vespilloides]